uniref:Uncharacterized protein n=1 Tax=Fundulus heteroclitus TaxID=8078 RepID=A0A3Q2PUM3_FUNHE
VLPRSNYSWLSAKGKGKGMMKEVLKGPEVCKDPAILTSYAVGVNIYKQDLSLFSVLLMVSLEKQVCENCWLLRFVHLGGFGVADVPIYFCLIITGRYTEYSHISFTSVRCRELFSEGRKCIHKMTYEQCG